jgi:3',5'-cyclic AMP phosphodiesterase CpdA
MKFFCRSSLQLIIVVALILVGVQSAVAFRFIAWADTKSGVSTLQAESKQAVTLDPDFTIYAGDVCKNWFTMGCFTTWKKALTGGSTNNMFDITFAVRGNHDSGSSTWKSAFDIARVAGNVGAANFSTLDTDLTYSFDYENSHFVGVDVLGDATEMTSAQISWVDNDLTAAEKRNLKHAFLFWHGPIYPLAAHCCSTNPAIISMLNKHPIVSATFHGHEHVVAYTHIDSSRIANCTHEFEEFVSGTAGAPLHTARSNRYDYWLGKTQGFIMVDVSGNDFTVFVYSLGKTDPVKVLSFSKPDIRTKCISLP